jgi:hypothetical protein
MLHHFDAYTVIFRLRHGSLLRRAGLSSNPLGSDVGVELGVRLEVVEDALVVERSNLDVSASIDHFDCAHHIP